MNDSTHECPAPGCGLRVRFDRLACLTHWRLVTPEHQRTLYREYRGNMGEDSYFAARADCLRDMGVPDADVAELNAGVA